MTVDERLRDAAMALRQEPVAPIESGVIARRARRRAQRRVAGLAVVGLAVVGSLAMLLGGRNSGDGAVRSTADGTTELDYDGFHAAVPDGWEVADCPQSGEVRIVLAPTATAGCAPTGAWIQLRSVSSFAPRNRECTPDYFGNGPEPTIARCMLLDDQLEVWFIDGLDVALEYSREFATIDDVNALLAFHQSITFDRSYVLPDVAENAKRFTVAWINGDCAEIADVADTSYDDGCSAVLPDPSLYDLQPTASDSGPVRTYRATTESGAYEVTMRYEFSTTTLRGEWRASGIRPAS